MLRRKGIVVNDRYGCLGHFRKGVCDNGRTIRHGDIERRVLAGLTDKLVSPEAVAVAVRAYAAETNRRNHERRAQAETSRRTLEKIERSIKGIMDAIEDGMYQPAMKARMGELAQQKAEIKARLTEAPSDLPDVHPNIAEHYRAKVIRLAETLAPMSDFTVETLEFLTNKEVTDRLNGASPGPGENDRIGFATLKGRRLFCIRKCKPGSIPPQPYENKLQH